MPKDSESYVVKDRIKAAQDYIQALSKGPDAVLAVLEGRDDPESIRRRIQTLLDMGKVSDAADVIRNREADPEWCDLAVRVLAENGEFQLAQRVVDSSSSVGDPNLRRRCVLAHGEGRLQRALQQHEDRSRQTSVVPPEQEQEMREVLDALRPITAVVAANELIENELESRAVQIALQASGLLGERQQAVQLGSLLATRKPIPIVLAHAVLQRWVDASEDLPQRLRDEHPGSFDAGVAAAVIEGERLGKPEPAFQSALQLVGLANSDDQRERLFGVIQNLAQDVGDDAMDRLSDIAPTLLRANPRMLSLYTATRMTQQGRLEEAGPVLEELRDEDNPHWLQAYANYLAAKGEKDPAADLLAKASQHFAHPDLLWRAAAVAYEVGHFEDSIRALEQLLNLTPNDIPSRNNLVAIHMRRQDYASAATHLAVLTQLDPDNEEYSLSYASSLVLSGQQDKALEVYNSICAESAAPLLAILARAQLLKSMNRVREAFDSLNAVRTQYWDTGQFLSVFLDIAFSAGEDDAGGEAFSRLRNLQDEGRIEPNVLIPMSLSDMVDRNEEYKRRKDVVHQEIIRGKLPWLVVERLLGRVSYWGWFIRTQPLKWVFDDPVNRAEYSIYSTNAFAAKKDPQGMTHLELLECPPRDTPVVADLSALITLHRLGLLDKAISYFGKILLPAAFLPHALEEGSRLVFHQGSLRAFYEKLEEAVTLQRIQVLADVGAPGHRPMPYVNEHTLKENQVEHYYRLRDVVAVLQDNGRISHAEYKRAVASDKEPSGVDADHPPLQLAASTLFELSTLNTLHSAHLLDPALEAFKVHISQADRQEVSNGLRAIEAQEKVRQWHEALWDIVRKDERFVPVALSGPEEISLANDRSPSRDVAIAACVLAKQHAMPLLADDRACQTVVLNEPPDAPWAAFGTDRLIIELEQTGLITRDKAADAFLKLIAWRYRFIVPPVWVLKTLADRFADNPPGRQLRDVARYLHDCMRDAGLFSGLEATQPPTSMGVRLLREWMQIIAEFVGDVWADSQFLDDAAKQLTQWAMTEFLPSPPLTLARPQQAHAGRVWGAETVIAYTMLNIPNIGDDQRGNLALRTVAEALGVGEDEDYLRVVTGVIDRASI